MDEIRKLNPEGREKYRLYIESLLENPACPPPFELLSDHSTSSQLTVPVEIEQKTFSRKFDMAEYIKGLLDPVNENPLSKEEENSVFDWLSLYFFDQICPPTSAGNRKPNKIWWYLTSEEWNRYYRHRIAGPVYLYRNYQKNSEVLLTKQPNVMSDTEETICSRIELAQNYGVGEALTYFYFNTDDCSIKRGATNKKNPGTLRRFVDIHDQLSRTYDLNSMNGASIASLFPSEFDKFRPSENQ